MNLQFKKKLLRKAVIFITCFMMLFTGAVTVMASESAETVQPNSASNVLSNNEDANITMQQRAQKTVLINYDQELESCTSADESIVRIINLDYDKDKVKIEGVHAGKTTITITTKSGQSQVCNVTVESCFSSLPDECEISIGESLEVYAHGSVEPYTWTSSDTAVATVKKVSESYDYRAYIKGVSEGTAIITVTNGLGDSKKVKVIVKTLALHIYKSYYSGGNFESTTIVVGSHDDFYLSYGNKKLSDCVIEISDPDVVSIKSSPSIGESAGGEVHALKPGNATVTITNQYGESDSFDVKVYKQISGIYFDKEEYSVYMGQQVAVDYTVNPENHNNEIVLDYDKEYLDVSKDGIVTPKTPGRWRITVYGKESKNVKGTCYINVIAPTFDKTKATLYKGYSTKITLTGGITDTTWSSSNPDVATVDNAGNVKAVSAGTATIIANTGGFIVKATITVENPYVSKKSLTLYRNKAATLKVTGAYGNVQWTSSNPEVATVSSKGVVTGKKVGTSTITAKASGENLTCKVVVKGPELSVKSKILYTGNIYTLKMYGTTGKVKWKSSNSKVAKVSSGGKITAVKKGSATITVKTEGKTYKCKVKVYNNQKSFKVDKNVYEYGYGEPEVVLSKVYFSKGKLKMNLYVMNNRIFKATKFNYIRYWLYDNNDRLIAYQKFKNVKLNIGPRKYKKITLTFSNKNVKNRNVILNKGVYDDWDYYYTYNY